MFTLATAQDLKYIKKIAQIDTDLIQLTELDEDQLLDYLRRATNYIHSTTRRQFLPYRQIRMYTSNLRYADLRMRSYPQEDLELDEDMLEAFQVQVTTGAVIASNESLPVGGLTRTASSFEATDPTGADANGDPRFAVGDILEIDSERLRVYAVSGTTVSVERGLLQTRAAAHAAGTAISKLVLATFSPGKNYYALDLNLTPATALRVVWPANWHGSAYTGTFGRGLYPQIFIDAYWGFHEEYHQEGFVDTLETVPVGDITASATSIDVANVGGRDAVDEARFTPGYLLRVDDELMALTDTTANDDPTPDTITVLRGQRGTIAQAHTAGTPIYRYSVPHQIREACLVVAKTWRDADQSVGGRQGVGEYSEGVEIAVPKDIGQIIRRHFKSV